MSVGDWFGVDRIRHFDGHLFDDAQVIDLDSNSLDILWRVNGLDWSQIKPSIFGTLFERSLDPAKRSQLGAHYTSEDDILLIVEPVLMAPLGGVGKRFRGQACKLAGERDAASTANRVPIKRAGAARAADGFHRGIGKDQGPGRSLWIGEFPVCCLAAAIGPVERGLGVCRQHGLAVYDPTARLRSPPHPSSSGSSSTSTPTNWPRRRSGSAISSGCARTASASRPSRS